MVLNRQKYLYLLYISTDYKLKMEQVKLQNQHINSKEVMQAEQEEAAEQPENYRQANRSQSDQTLKRRDYKFKPMRFLNAQSEKRSSEHELSNISEKFARAAQKLSYARDDHRSKENRVSKLLETYDYCIRNNSGQTKRVFEKLQTTQKQLDMARQTLNKAQEILSKLEEAQEKQIQIHQKRLMQRHMI